MNTPVRNRSAAIIAFGLAAGAFAADSAQAAQYGFYVAGYYGNAEKTVAKANYDNYATFVYDFYGFTPSQTVSTISDGKDSSFGMAAGYRLLPWLAFEGGYMDLGSVSYRNDSFGTNRAENNIQEPWQQRIESTTSGIALSALGIWPISYSWEVYGRAGVLVASNKLDIFITDFFGAASPSISDSSFELLAGVGASMAFAEVYSLRLEFQRVFKAGEAPAEGDVDILSLGFTVSF